VGIRLSFGDPAFSRTFAGPLRRVTPLDMSTRSLRVPPTRSRPWAVPLALWALAAVVRLLFLVAHGDQSYPFSLFF